MVLVDTSSWIETLRQNGDASIRARVERLTLNDEAALCEMVLLELWIGARGNEEKRKLAELEKEIARLPITDEVWRLSQALAKAARLAGLTVPAADLLIAACARFHETGLEHCDEHFNKLDKLKLD